MKQCPFCAEEIHSDAIKCKHCSELLTPYLPAISTPPLPWYFRTTPLVILILSIGPLALPLIWLHPKLSKIWKITITLITLISTYLLWQMSVSALNSLNESIETLHGMGL